MILKLYEAKLGLTNFDGIITTHTFRIGTTKNVVTRLPFQRFRYFLHCKYKMTFKFCKANFGLTIFDSPITMYIFRTPRKIEL